jgi:hypothetical protein
MDQHRSYSVAASISELDVDAAIWNRVVQFDSPPSPTAARSLLKLQFPQRDRERMAELAAQARAGKLTAAEEREAEAYERLGCLLDILHSHARRVLKRPRAAS